MKHTGGLVLIYSCLLFLLPAQGFAQIRDLRDAPGESLDTLPDGITPLDTAVPMSFVLLDQFRELVTVTDSFDWQDLHHDPLPFPYSHLGNLGSAARSLTSPSGRETGFTTGWTLYDPYFVQEYSFRYYNQATPVAKIKYSQAGQDDTYLTLDFGRNFANGLNFSIAYQRINQIGEFAHQQQKNTGLGFGVWHDAPSGKYDAFYNLISNAATGDENGGITSDEFIGDPLVPDASIPTRIMMGTTSQRHRTFITKQIFHLTPDSASLGFDIWLKAAYKTALYKFTDEGASAFPEYYPSPYLFDERGIRQYVHTRMYDASLGIAMPWVTAHSAIETSLRYKNIRLDQEPEQRDIHELYLEARGLFQWIDPLRLRGELSLGLGQADGNYSFSASGEINTGLFGTLTGNWSILSRNPSLVESKLYVNQLQVYDYHFKNPFISEVDVNWKIEKQDLEAGISWSVYDNHIYFDSLAMPVQMSETFSVRRFYVVKDFDFRWVGMGGRFVWQPGVRDELALPETAVTANVYGRIGLFQRKLIVMPGVDVTYFSRYAGVSYFPVNGVYHLREEDTIPSYTRIDAGVGININFLRVYLRMEDIEGFFKDRVLYQADLYPHYRGYVRLGIEAGFFN